MNKLENNQLFSFENFLKIDKQNSDIKNLEILKNALKRIIPTRNLKQI